ncbi:MAG: sugar transferase [Candidatus Marinimicrobia bacterium]|jgi:lipopolysaccharide/colanic/teichoic acid biosynthesis glycosyltransferase|nr:sugar transferase [Candidatus Neomarinimicrobiota bacterium]|tara:strand:- start:1455 stop:2069 length:615 start_codon:yes stop_codon:yes gene_type:complete
MIKRFVDILLSLIGLILLSPLLLIISLLILLMSGYPILFKQVRLGKLSSEFTIYKFRTMRKGVSLSSKHDEMRITIIGNLLRRTSLDELPALFNVLKGDMSLVGPRPLLIKYKDRFNDYQNQRHLINPGITGLAQIKGRNKISWEEKLDYDIYYVQNKNFFLDIKILFITFFQIITGWGISQEGKKIMPEFYDSKKIKNKSDDS